MQNLARHGVVCLNEDWRMQSSAQLSYGGSELSKPGKKLDGWYKARLPATVLGTLVEAGVYEEPFVGMNLRDIPGQGPLAQNFSNHPMPDDSPFAVSWWFRREFLVPKGADRVVLAFDGVNYRANLWLNGELVTDSKHMTGAYRAFEFDISERVDRTGLNVIALEIAAPTSCELALTWVDWNPSPPDKNMGIWKDVWLYTSGAVALRAPHVSTRLKGHERANLTVGGDLVNLTDRKVHAEVRGSIDGKVFTAAYELAAGETRRFDIDENLSPVLSLSAPRLWWPRVLGEPALYECELEVFIDGELSDKKAFPFGVREITSELNEHGYAQFKVNGVPLVLRGAGWAGDLFLRRDEAKDLAQLEYVKHMNLNTIRFEGMLERTAFLERCDREGVLVIAGFCCCDCWEKWEKWGPENHYVAGESLRSLLRHARRHPSLVSFWYGSDFPPPEEVERLYLRVLEEERWPNPYQSSASQKPAPITGNSGLKMLGPYEYVPPNYWLEDPHRGGAWGFATEISPGPAIPPIESLRKFIPDEHLWPVNEVWNYHAGGADFHQVKHFTDALNARYGEVQSAAELAKFSQLATYEGQRAMFEAYAKARPKATGVIQWMLNNAWPGLIWHLYDYYLRAGGGFYGTKKACEPLHAMWADDDQAVYVVNDTQRAFASVRVRARVFDTKLSTLFIGEAKLEVAPGQALRALALPDRSSFSDVYFLDLRLLDEDGQELGNNLYWLPRELDVLDHEKNFWMHTPIAKYADLSAVRGLDTAEVELVATRVDNHTLRVELTNPLARLAFFMELRLADASGDDILPALYSDNYLSLVPGEARVVEIRLPDRALPAGARLELAGINVPKRTLSLDALVRDSIPAAAQ